MHEQQTVTGPAAWTDQEVEDHISGSGAGDSEWYWQLKRSSYEPSGDPQGSPGRRFRFIVVIDDPSGDNRQVTAVFAEDDFRRVAIEVMEGVHGANEEVRRAIRNDDLDAEAVDCIIQVIALGEISYS